MYRPLHLSRLLVLPLLVLACRTGAGGAHGPDADAIVDATAPHLRAGDVVAILSNGGFGNIYKKLPDAIAAQRPAAQSV